MSDEKLKPIVALKTLQIIERRRYLPNTQFYFTNRRVSHGAVKRQLASGAHPFRTPPSDKIISFIKYSDKREKLVSLFRISKPVHLKDSVRVAQTKGLSERVHVQEMPEHVRTVLELHPEFYSVIEGRPLRTFDDIKLYLNNIRGYAMLRQQIGYRNDIAMKIAKYLEEEMQQYNGIQSTYKQHVKNFEIFLREDYQKSVSKIQKSEKIVAALNGKILELYGHASALNILNNVIFKLDAIRNVLKMYRKYLFHVSPLSWRQQNDETYQRTTIQFDSDVERNAMAENTEIDKIVQNALVELRNAPKPILYFQEPEEMLYLFRTLELQGREYLLHTSSTVAPMAQLKERARQLRRAVAHEQDHFHYYIKSLDAAERRERDSEALIRQTFFDILHGPFFDTVASPQSLKLKICIEYVFERIFGKSEDVHQNIREPMKLLELMYEEFNLALDGLNLRIVNRARDDFFAQDLRMMKQAHLAARELKTFEEMSNLIRKAFLPPYKPCKIKPTHRKQQKQQVTEDKNEGTKAEHKKTILQLSESDKNNLFLFTDWCEGEDPTPFMECIRS